MPERWFDAGVPELRADVCEVHATREEAVLLFGTQLAGTHAKLERCIILTPVMAKRLAAGLDDVIREHEAQTYASTAGNIQSTASDDHAPAAAGPLPPSVRSFNVAL